MYKAGLLSFLYGAVRVWGACLPSGSDKTINDALKSAGAGGKVQLCRDSVFTINNAVVFTADGQELSTEGYPAGTGRATISISGDNSDGLTTMVTGTGRSKVKLLNLIIDGNRPDQWVIPTVQGASIVLGGASNGIQLSGLDIRRPRGWACIHVIEGTTSWPYTCTGANITNNDIGPAGTESQPSAGIVMVCTASTISNNRIRSVTRGGISLYGAPGTVVNGNSIVAGPENQVRGISMTVADPYSGNFSGVRITSNTISAGSYPSFIKFGLPIGRSVDGPFFDNYHSYSGPVTVTGNTLTGNIVFPVIISGWKNGLTVTGNTLTGVAKRIDIADANFGTPATDCENHYSTWKTFESSARGVYYPPSVEGPLSLQSDITPITSGPPDYFLCPGRASPASLTYTPGGLYVGASQGNVAVLHRGYILQLKSDNNLVMTAATNPDTIQTAWASGKGGYPCSSTYFCYLKFESNSNLVNVANGTLVWSSNTATGEQNKLVIRNTAPWIQILNPRGAVIWDTTKLK